mmetsp:Transcript_33092/g.42280  ORF Transcript_33092/g.42280 Transcript_33092/m.42280 type:complete len:109 (-) Transcript_33092:76-402(-)
MIFFISPNYTVMKYFLYVITTFFFGFCACASSLILVTNEPFCTLKIQKLFYIHDIALSLHLSQLNKSFYERPISNFSCSDPSVELTFENIALSIRLFGEPVDVSHALN